MTENNIIFPYYNHGVIWAISMYRMGKMKIPRSRCCQETMFTGGTINIIQKVDEENGTILK